MEDLTEQDRFEMYLEEKYGREKMNEILSKEVVPFRLEIPYWVHKYFKMLCAFEDITMRDKIVELIRECLEEQYGKNLEEREKPKK